MRRTAIISLALAVAAVASAAPLAASGAEESESLRAPFVTAAGLAVELVPEMATPTGIAYQDAGVRRALRREPAAAAAENLMLRTTRELWPDLRTLDLLELSRYQLEATVGWSLPETPGELIAETVGRDPETGELSVEVRGPRLPAKYDIVFRYLYLYGVYDPVTEDLRRLVVTLRGWVEE